jgi:dolichol-phosphate mannosyltransferase
MIGLSIIVPTLNESENIELLVGKVRDALGTEDWEIIFVDDDSTDGTANRIALLARSDQRIRLIHRIGRRGLASACIEGCLSSTAPYLAIMDADLQHNEALLQKMLEELKADKELGIVIGSRFTEGGGTGDWHRQRLALTNFASRVSSVALHHDIADPMSGFFMMRRDIFVRAAHDLSGLGFKILLDILAVHRSDIAIKELPYEFRNRHSGDSKLSVMVMLEHLTLLADKTIGRFIPIRFLMFLSVGAIGLMIHLALLGMLNYSDLMGFKLSQVLSSLVAMIFNFLMNNSFTYKDYKLRGRDFVKGLLIFVVLCGVGLLLNLVVAYELYDYSQLWLTSGLAGAVIGALWNYTTNSSLNWKVQNSR